MKIRLSTPVLAFVILASIAGHSQPGVLKKVKCAADPTQQYALLLPPDYDTAKTYPLLIFLDPGAQGDYAVNLYREPGARYDVILAGSFNSRNFEPGVSETSFLAIYNDIVKLFNIDAGRIWLSGFSGGARISAALAMRYPAITGVIGCGAGFVDDQNDFTKMQAYAGIVGTADMNYGEQMDNNELLDQLKVSNILLHYDGGHEWPPVAAMDNAMAWLMERNGDKVNTAPTTDSLTWKRVQQQADSGFHFMSWFECKQLEKISPYSDKAKTLISSLESRKEFNSDKKLFEMAREEETNTMNEFSISFSQLLYQPAGIKIDKSTWEQHAQKIKRLQNNKNRYMQLAAVRCADHSRRSCSENYFQWMSTKSYAKALDLATVLSYLDPTSARASLLMARAAAGLGNKRECERFLKEAVRKGLSVGRRLEEDALLLSLLTRKEIREIVEEKNSVK